MDECVPPAFLPTGSADSVEGSDSAMASGGFAPACKLVKTKEDMNRFHKSSAFADLTGFVIALNAAVMGKTITDECMISPAVQAMIDVLKSLEVQQRLPTAADS